jgi:hypothetical protein
MAVSAAAVVALVVSPAAHAGSATDRAQGGGQVLIGTRGGAGDTIAFTAQGAESAATGDVQYVQRTPTSQTVLHATVTCLLVNGNTAKLAGAWDQGGTFTIVAVDNGQGAAADDDMISINNGAEPNCSRDNNDQNNNTALARGNVQVYDAG